MKFDASPEARALVEKWECDAEHGGEAILSNLVYASWDRRDIEEARRRLALAIDEHTAAAVLAEREAIIALIQDREADWAEANVTGTIGKRRSYDYVQAARALGKALTDRTPPAGRGTR